MCAKKTKMQTKKNIYYFFFKLQKVSKTQHWHKEVELLFVSYGIIENIWQQWDWTFGTNCNGLIWNASIAFFYYQDFQSCDLNCLIVFFSNLNFRKPKEIRDSRILLLCSEFLRFFQIYMVFLAKKSLMIVENLVNLY